jgi:hypothetical protein
MAQQEMGAALPARAGTVAVLLVWAAAAPGAAVRTQA